MFCSRKLNNKINYIHERALRMVYFDYTSSFEELLKKDKSISIHHRNIHNVAIEMYKVRNNLSPPFIQEIFNYQGYGRVTRTGEKFTKPKINKVYKGESSLRHFGPLVWNTMLPNMLKTCSSLAEFKNNIKSWIPSNCPCRLCNLYVNGVGFVKTIE